MSAYELYIAPKMPVTHEHTPYSTPRRKALDHARYMAHREEHKARQREYYRRNRERILQWHKDYIIRQK